MQRFIIIAASSAMALLTTLAEPAQAQANRTFVSGGGVDSNSCSLSAPCRSFSQALSQTNAGGEIAVLDTAGYGAVTINKSVSIVNQEGVEAGITVTSHTDAITVNVGASDVVNLRGLTLTGGGVGNNGIEFANLGALNLQNCVIRGFAGDGMAFFPTGSATFNVSDVTVSGVGTAAIVIAPTGSGTVNAAFNRVQAVGNSNGFLISGSNATGAVNVTIANSAATSNAAGGISIEGAVGKANTQAMVSNSVVSNNGTGIFEDGANSITYLAKNTIAGNSTAFSVLSSGQLFSFGDNYIKANGADGAAISLVSTK